MTTYYQLRCATCDELFKPLVSTEPNELLNPDYEQSAEQAGESNTDQLRAFHDQHTHMGHITETVEVTWTRVENGDGTPRLVPLRLK